MLKPFTEATFAIDIVIDAYNLDDAFTIVNLIKEDLDIDVTVSQVLDYMGRVDDHEQESNNVRMNQIF
jgi:hypothetical protein